MLLARKLKSAAVMLRRKGLSDAANLARLRAAQLLLAHRPLPSDPVRRARMLGAVLNRHSLAVAVPVGAADLAGLREAVLVPYLRHRFAEAAAAARSLGPLRAVEVAILADALLATWDFRGIAEALPGWTRSVAGTPFALRVAQVGRRAALRLGRLGEAAGGIDRDGDELGSLVLRGDVRDAMGRMDEARAAGLPVVALTNDMTDFHGQEWVDDQEWLDHFDTVVDAYATGDLKPAPEAYAHGVAAAGVPAEEIVYLDDLPVNVAGARAAGLQTIEVQYDDRPAPQGSPYPPVTVDVSLTTAADVAAAQVAEALAIGGGDLLEDVRLFDLYLGEQVEQGRRSLTFRLRFRAPDRTLTSEEANAARDAATAIATERWTPTRRGSGSCGRSPARTPTTPNSRSRS